jgi:hypothetical protein
MVNLKNVAAVALVAQLAVPGWVLAGTASMLDSKALDTAVSQRVDEDKAERARIASLLQRPEVRDVARERGLDLARAESAIATLQGEELQRAAALAATVDSELSGAGQTKHYVILGLAAIGAIVVLLAILD